MTARTLLAAAACSLALSASAQTPAPAAAPAPRMANLKVMGCEEFLKLQGEERAAVVWYLSGDFKEAGRTLTRFDLDLAPRAVPETVKACTEKPQANLLYTVANWFKANMPKPEKKAKKAAKK